MQTSQAKWEIRTRKMVVIWLAPGLMQKEGFRVAVGPTIQLQRSSNLAKAAVSVQKLECKFSLIRSYIFIFTNLLAVRAYIIYKPGADTPETLEKLSEFHNMKKIW